MNSGRDIECKYALSAAADRNKVAVRSILFTASVTARRPCAL